MSVDPLDIYLQDVARRRLLSRKEELAWARKAHAGDEKAMHKLAAHNLRFAISVAKKYQYRGLPLSDLIAEANKGLVRAAQKFDPNLGVKFISYAVWWIRQSILKALAETGDHATIYVPLYKVTAYTKAIRELGRRGQPVTPEAVVKITSLDMADAQVLFERSLMVCLDAPTEDTGKSTPKSKHELVRDARSDPLQYADPYENEDELAEREGILEELFKKVLTARERKIISWYFGLDEGEGVTLEVIGGKLGVTRERIRQLRDRALVKLKKESFRLSSEKMAVLRGGVFETDLPQREE